MNDQSCIIQSVSPVNITCSVFGYYPTIELYFRQNAEILHPLNLIEMNNTDGTRNKTVTITATSNDIPYTCVASDIPGLSGHQRETTAVLVAGSDEESTSESNTVTVTITVNENDSNKARLIRKYLLRFESLNSYIDHKPAWFPFKPVPLSLVCSYY